jgi:hypothetical protein
LFRCPAGGLPAVSRGLNGLRRRPLTTPRIRVVWMQGSRRNLMAGGLLMPDSPVDSTAPSRLCSPRRSTVAGDAQLGLRRPRVSSMSPYRREQAISAIADLLIVQLEREAQQPALHA